MNRTYIKIWLGVLFASLLMTACGPGKAEKELKQQEDLAKEVLAVHDEVMPRMGELTKLRKQVKEKLNAWTADPTVDHTAEINAATQVIAELETADKDMMDWMHTYNGGQGLYEHDLIMAYLNEEKIKILAVQDRTDLAVEHAVAFLEEHK